MQNNHDQATGLRRLMQCSRPRIMGFLPTDKDVQLDVMTNLSLALSAMQVDVVIANTEVENFEVGEFNAANHIRSISLADTYEENLASELIALAQRHDVVLLNTSIQRIDHLQTQGLRLMSPLSILDNTELVVQFTNNPDSIKKAYLSIKSFCERFGRQTFSVLVHGVTEKVAKQLFKNLANTAKQFMQVELLFIGHIPADIYSNKALQLGRSVVDAYPMAAASKAFKALAYHIHYVPDAILEMNDKAFG